MEEFNWLYNELQQVGVDYENIEEVARYDRRMHKLRDISSEIEDLIMGTAPTSDATVLEIGTGTGEFALALAARAQKVTAIDVSPVMLEYAQKKAEERGIKNIEFQHAGFLSFKSAPAQFDIIFTQLALHHLPDFWKSIALKKIYNQLKPGGKFFLKDVVYPSGIMNYEEFFQSVVAGIENSAGAEFTQEIMNHIRKEYSTLDWIMDRMLKDSGFTITESNIEKAFIYKYLCTK